MGVEASKMCISDFFVYVKTEYKTIMLFKIYVNLKH